MCCAHPRRIARECRHPGTDRQTDECNRLGAKALFVRTDVTDEAEVAGLVRTVMDEFGRFDVAFNNAGQVAFVSMLSGGVAATNNRALWVTINNSPALVARAGSAVPAEPLLPPPPPHPAAAAIINASAAFLIEPPIG